MKLLNQNNIIEESNPDITSKLPSDCFDNLKGAKGKAGEFAVYEIWVNQDLSVEKINQIKEFSNSQLNRELDKCINNISFRKTEKNEKIESKYKKIIPIFFYEDEDGNPSFVSLWDL